MKKMFLILVLFLSLVFVGFAENSEKSATVKKDNFKIKPKLFWSFISPLVIRPFSLSNYRFGLTIVGLDGSLLKYKNFCFLAAGVGLQTYHKKEIGWHVYHDYWGYPQWYYGEGYEFKFEFYLKFVPIKYRWEWASKILKIDSYLELGITNKKDIVFGVTFSGNPFAKKKVDVEEEKKD